MLPASAETANVNFIPALLVSLNCLFQQKHMGLFIVLRKDKLPLKERNEITDVHLLVSRVCKQLRNTINHQGGKYTDIINWGNQIHLLNLDYYDSKLYVKLHGQFSLITVRKVLLTLYNDRLCCFNVELHYSYICLTSFRV